MTTIRIHHDLDTETASEFESVVDRPLDLLRRDYGASLLRLCLGLRRVGCQRLQRQNSRARLCRCRGQAGVQAQRPARDVAGVAHLLTVHEVRCRAA